MKRLMNVSEANEVCQDRVKWRLIVSVYPNRNPKGVSSDIYWTIAVTEQFAL